MGEIMTAAGVPTLVGGNIGTPAISLAERAKPETVVVLEISSFQLETVQTFHPKIAVVLNVTPNHLDRHRTFEIYTDAKARIFENQQGSDFAVLNADDPNCVAMGARTRAQVFWFSRQKEVQQGAWVRDGNVVFRDSNGQREILQVSEIPLKGAHNLENVLAAVCSGVLMGCAPEKVRQAVRDFKAVEHRLEFVATIRSEEHTSELQSLRHLVCRLLLEKKNQLPKLAARLGGEAGGGLVEKQHVGVVHQRARHREPLLLAARGLAHPGLAFLLELHPAQH